MNLDLNEIELRRVDLNLLPVFCALMRSRSVKGAAERLRLGAPAVSMALSRLRATVGDPLFVRGRAGLEPTPRALALAHEIGPALDALRGGVLGQPAFNPATSERTFRFAAPDDLENYLVPRLVERLVNEAPGVSLVVRAADYKVVRQLLDSGEADVALTAPPAAIERRYRREVVQASETFLALYDEAQLKMAPGNCLTRDLYLATPHLLRSPSGELSGMIDQLLSAQGLQRCVSVSVARFTVAPYILKRIPSIINVPATTARLFAQEFNLAVCDLPLEITPTFDVCLIWPARADADKGLAWFRNLVREVLGSLTLESTS